MNRRIRAGFVAVVLLIAWARAGRACEDQTWQAVAARPSTAASIEEPPVLRTIAAAGWQLKSARGALPAVQLAHNEGLEFQDFIQYAFQGGALRLCVSRGSGGGEIFALLVDTRSPDYRGFADLGSTKGYAAYQHGSSVLVVPTRPVRQALFDTVKTRRWAKGGLQRVLGTPSFRWHAHGVGSFGLTYVPQGLSFIGDSEGLDAPVLYEVSGAGSEEFGLPPIESVARLDYSVLQPEVRDGFANEFLCEREQIDQELATGTTSPNGRFVAAPVNLGGLANTQEVVVSERGKPERRYPAPHFIETDCLWLDNRTVLFKIRVPEDTIYSMDVLSGALQLVLADDRGVSKFGVSDAHHIWYTTADGQTHTVAMQHQ